MSIRIKNLRYTYSPGLPNETCALDGVSLFVPDNSVLGIIGHTGSGKSTLLQLIDGLLKADSGEIYVGNTCITDPKVKMAEVRRRVGMVFQYPEYQLFEENVAKDVAYGPKNIGITDEKELYETVRNALAIVGLDYDKIADRSPFELSGGQKRRVAIAGVIAMKPEVLILDEPTAGLDPGAHREILRMIRDIHEKEKIILIFVSHNMGDVADLSDQVIVMEKGRNVLSGTPQEVFSERDYLKRIGLSVPPVTEIMKKIEESLPNVDGNILSVDEAEEELVRMLI